MGDKPGGGQYIETVPRVGFVFTAQVKDKEKVIADAGTAAEEGRGPHVGRYSGTLVSAPEGERKPLYRRFTLSNPLVAVAALVIAVVAATLISAAFSARASRAPALQSADNVISSPSDEAEVKRVVKESQEFETLDFYVHPDSFDESKLREYWLPAEQGGKAILQVEKQVASLRSKGRHFGGESEMRQFDFRDVRIYAGRDYAEVRTEEKWYVPLYEADGSRVMDKNPILAYPVDYMLKKVNGRWLLEENGTPRPQEKK